MPPVPTQASIPSNSTSPTFEDKSAEQVHKLTAPFLNRLRSNNNAQIEKILEIFNQVKIDIHLLDAIQQVPSYAKFLKDMFTKKIKINVPKISNQIPVKYKDPSCPTIS